MENETNVQGKAENSMDFKFCSECGQKIAKKAVVCPSCGCSAEEKSSSPQIVIQNSNQNQVAAPMGYGATPKNKWTALLLWLFLGFLGAHKFYEGKVGMGILYMFTVGFFGIGLFFDFFSLLFKPTTYYV